MALNLRAFCLYSEISTIMWESKLLFTLSARRPRAVSPKRLIDRKPANAAFEDGLKGLHGVFEAVVKKKGRLR